MSCLTSSTNLRYKKNHLIFFLSVVPFNESLWHPCNCLTQTLNRNLDGKRTEKTNQFRSNLWFWWLWFWKHDFVAFFSDTLLPITMVASLSQLTVPAASNVQLWFQGIVSMYAHLPWWLGGKASACNAGDLDSIPGSWRSPGEGNGNPLQDSAGKFHGLQFMGSQRVGHDWVTSLSLSLMPTFRHDAWRLALELYCPVWMPLATSVYWTLKVGLVWIEMCWL